VNVAIILQFSEDIVRKASLTFGAVAPTIIHASDAEKFLVGKKLNEETIEQAARLAMQSTRPIDDIRGSAKYRRVISRVITRRGLLALREGEFEDGFPEEPVLLAGKKPGEFVSRESAVVFSDSCPIETTINGRQYSISGCQHKTLLRMLREDVGLIGTKEGCSEGECGACTVLLDDVAVMSCMVPAPQAHGASIRTIEGVGIDGQLHPVQSAFLKAGAVQCGYCTPGFVISAVKLLEEHAQPTKNQIEQALTGNLCRCTGYYKIINAIEEAALQGGG
jgi:carbon-monoxide dehydrogenase medium subunit